MTPLTKLLVESREKKILDVCCGGRMFWFDRTNPNALFLDIRKVEPRIVGKGKQGRVRSVLPDKIMDFRKLDIPDNSYPLVVFDPPHFTSLGEKSFMAETYGRLDRTTWREDLSKGFAECFRVLKPDGVLIFKWNEHDIPLKEVLKLTPVQPLFGHPSGKAMKTHWVTFMKEALDSAIGEVTE